MTDFNTYEPSSRGFADYLADHHHDRLRYATDTGSFYKYTGTHWAECSHVPVEVRHTVSVNATHVREHMPPKPEKDHPDFYSWTVQAAFVKLAGSSAGVSDVLNRLKDDPRIWCQLNDFANKPHLLNFRNGTVHLDMPYTSPDGEQDEYYFRRHDPADMLATCLAVDYPEYERPDTPLWTAMLEYMCGNDSAFAQNLESALAYGLLGSNPEQLIVLLVGDAAIGKSQVLEIVTGLAGNLGGHGKIELVQKLYGQEHDSLRSDLRGKHFVMLGETSHRLKLDEIKFKDLTGSSFIPTRKLGQQPVPTRVTWTMYCATNDLPEIPGEMDDAMARRFWIFPLPAKMIPPAKRDSNLPAKIIEQEGAAILYRLVRHLSGWYSEGGRIRKHARCEMALDRYRTDSNTVQEFVLNCLREDQQGWVSYDDLNLAYAQYCDKRKLQGVSRRQLPKKIQEVMMTVERDSSHSRLKGVSLSYEAPSWT